nr:hypothetical protein [Sphingomonas sp. SCN 67-18]
MATLPTAKPSFFGQGGTGRQIVGILGDALSAAGGGQGVYAPMMQQQRMFKQQSQREDERSRLLADRQMELARFKAANPDEPSIIRTARSLGLQPGTDAFTSFVTNAVMAPRYMMMGSPETGQSIVQVGGMSDGPSPSLSRVTDASSYDALPSGAHFLDPDGNERVKP